MGIRAYRPDIDGLRAIAVLLVILFHIQLGPFTGGFVGVDVFFVISGFLITRLIVSEIEEGRFSFANFYLRRARRILPALFFTVAISFLIAAILLSPEMFKRFGASVFYAIISGSNFLFWSEDGYFDAPSHFKPLLHTWSLSIEEQYYMVWPALLVALLTLKMAGARCLILAFLLAAAALSLFFSESWLNSDAQGAFFLTPFRVFEFAIGALCVWLIAYQPRRELWLELIAAAGLTAIICAAMVYDEETRFPGVNALVPGLGTAALIYAGTAPKIGRILGNKALVSVGLISYSLYLAHWPIWVFYRYWAITPPVLLDKVLVIVASTATAIVMYFYVERPFRVPRQKQRLSPVAFATACIAVALLLSVPAIDVQRDHGWSWRYPPEIRPYIEEPSRLRTGSLVRARQRQPFPIDGRINGLIIGDSHAKDVFNAFEQNSPAVYLKYVNIEYLCQPVTGPRPLPKPLSDRCDREFNKFLVSKDLVKADYIIFAARWQEWAVDKFDQTLRVVRSFTDAKVMVFGPAPEFPPGVPELIAKHRRLHGLEDFLDNHQSRDRHRLSARFRQLAETDKFIFVDTISTLCGSGPCPFRLPNKSTPIFVDYGHLSLDGAAYFGRLLRHKHPELCMLFNQKPSCLACSVMTSR